MSLITVETHASMGHRLPTYDGLCSSLHGHNVRFVATVQVRDGEFLDFKSLRTALAELTDPMDHALVLQESDPWARVLDDSMHDYALDQRLVLLNVEPTTENIAAYIFSELGKKYFVRDVVVHETEKYAATCMHHVLPPVERVL